VRGRLLSDEQFRRLAVDELAAAEAGTPAGVKATASRHPNGPDVLGPREFQSKGVDCYRLTLPQAGIRFEVDRLRRERHELIGELAVYCALPGAKTVNGALSIGNLNLSSTRARQERAKFLAQRARTKDIDWVGLVEEFAQRVLAAEREGGAAADLRTLPAPGPENNLEVEGLVLPRRHPTIFFGDGGAAKSYLALWLAGRLAELGVSVGLFDWELAAEDHRDRLERLFPEGMPRVIYARCERPLTYEADRLLRIVREHKIEYAVFDSIGFACDGPPEAAEVAGAYFRAVRRLGVGSLHVAHIAKAEGGDKKPFGSVFWHNGARATWFVKLDDSSPDGSVLTIGLFPRKNNLRKLQEPLGFQVIFEEYETIFRPADVADSPDLSATLTVRQRMIAALKRGAASFEELAEEIDASVETVKRTARRYKKLFVVLDGGRVGLAERRAE